MEELEGFEGVRVVWDLGGGEEACVGEEERGEESGERVGVGGLGDEGEERESVVGDWW